MTETFDQFMESMQIALEKTFGEVEVVRTPKQNNALHLWFDQLAQALNEAGSTVNDGILVRLPVLWTEENVKEILARPYMKALFPDISSTTKLEKDQVSTLYKYLDNAISERIGVHVEFPSEESKQ